MNLSECPSCPKQMSCTEYSGHSSSNGSHSSSISESIRSSFADIDDNLLNLRGIKFYKYTQNKVKFSFTPSELFKNVLREVIFYCTLRFTGKYWRITRESFPINYKEEFYKLFWNKTSFIITDEHLNSVIQRIYSQLEMWSKIEHNRRRVKIQKFRLDPSSVDLDSEDEILFLSEEERLERRTKKMKILKRMLPPTREQLRKLRNKYYK